MKGSTVSRKLVWTPGKHQDWVVPPGGFPVSFVVTQFPTQPADLRLSAPQQIFQYGPVHLDVQLFPEFVTPTPDPTGDVPINMTAFLGEKFTVTVKAQQRNQAQQVDIIVALDPGLPNMALITEAIESPASRVLPFTSTRDLIWTPGEFCWGEILP